MQSYIYDKSLNFYFSYKGRNSHVPTLSPHNLRICILGDQFVLDDPSLPSSGLPKSQSHIVLSGSASRLTQSHLDSGGAQHKEDASREAQDAESRKSNDTFWSSLWKRKSQSDLEGRRRRWNKERLEKNVMIENKVFGIAWFTYRKGFRKSCYKKKRSDSGWGCMIRSGQMLLFTVLRRLLKMVPFKILGN